MSAMSKSTYLPWQWTKYNKALLLFVCTCLSSKDMSYDNKYLEHYDLNHAEA